MTLKKQKQLQFTGAAENRSDSNTPSRDALSSRASSRLSAEQSRRQSIKPQSPPTPQLAAETRSLNLDMTPEMIRNHLKTRLIAKLNPTFSFRKVLESKEFETMLINSIEYIRWYVKETHLQKLKEQTTASLKRDFPGEFLKLFQIKQDDEIPLESISVETATLEQAKTQSFLKLNEFAKSYCMLVLIISTDKNYWEHIYFLIKEITTMIIEPAFKPSIHAQLNKLFRSEMFVGSHNNDTRNRIRLSDVRSARSPLAVCVLPKSQQLK